MTNCYFWLIDKNLNSIKKIRVQGHTGSNESGKDIICSAISTAVIMSGNLLEKVSPKNKIVSDEKTTTMEIEINDDSEMSSLVALNLYETLVDLASQYPRFIKIFKEEVTC